MIPWGPLTWESDREGERDYGEEEDNMGGRTAGKWTCAFCRSGGHNHCQRGWCSCPHHYDQPKTLLKLVVDNDIGETVSPERVSSADNTLQTAGPVSPALQETTMAESNLPATLLDFTPEQIEIIKNTVAKGASDDELKLFIEVCKARGLNPFLRQIYAIKRKVWDRETRQYKWVIVHQTGIDGFRLIAERSKKYAGQLGPYWTDDGEKWVDVWLKDTPPKAAKVAALRRDFKEPLWAVARFQAYAQTVEESGRMRLIDMWARMSAEQIAKCAEALALRKAFPEDLSGIYTHEEMAQADNVRNIYDSETAGANPEKGAAGEKIDQPAPAEIIEEEADSSSEAEGDGQPETIVEDESQAVPDILTGEQGKMLGKLISAKYPGKGKVKIQELWDPNFNRWSDIKPHQVREFCQKMKVDVPTWVSN